MIQISKLFIEAYSSNEQLIMLRLLLSADNNGVAEFSDRAMSKLTGVPYQQVRTIHQKWIQDGTIANAPTNAGINAGTNAGLGFVTICDYASYIPINIYSNAPTNAPDNAPINAGKEQEITKETDKVFPLTPLQTEKENNKEKELSPPYMFPPTNQDLQTQFDELKKKVETLRADVDALKEKSKSKPFVPPTVEEVDAYVKEMGYTWMAQSFVDFYQSKGWMVGKNKMKDWKSACRTWENKRKQDSPQLFNTESIDNAPKELVIDGQVYR